MSLLGRNGRHRNAVNAAYLAAGVGAMIIGIVLIIGWMLFTNLGRDYGNEELQKYPSVVENIRALSDTISQKPGAAEPDSQMAFPCLIFGLFSFTMGGVILIFTPKREIQQQERIHE